MQYEEGGYHPQMQSPEMSYKKSVLKNFTKLSRKHLCQSFFFNKVASLRPATLLKKRLQHKCFPVNLVKFLRIIFLRSTPETASSSPFRTATFISLRAFKYHICSLNLIHVVALLLLMMTFIYLWVLAFDRMFGAFEYWFFVRNGSMAGPRRHRT